MRNHWKKMVNPTDGEDGLLEARGLEKDFVKSIAYVMALWLVTLQRKWGRCPHEESASIWIYDTPRVLMPVYSLKSYLSCLRFLSFLQTLPYLGDNPSVKFPKNCKSKQKRQWRLKKGRNFQLPPHLTLLWCESLPKSGLSEDRRWTLYWNFYFSLHSKFSYFRITRKYMESTWDLSHGRKDIFTRRV